MARKNRGADPEALKKSRADIWQGRPKISCFEDILKVIDDFPVRRVAVACAEDATVLQAVAEARRREIAEYILVGDRDGILRRAGEAGVELEQARIEHQADPLKAASLAVKLVNDGEADIVMKGFIYTDDFLRAVLDRDNGLRAGAVMSHVFVLEDKRQGRLLFVSDAAMNIQPDLETKADIIMNAVHLASMFGLERPRVAVLGAVEVVNPAMPATVEAAALAKMSERRQFSADCIIDGPFGLDNAIDVGAAKHKRVEGPVAGMADILIVPDIESGNILAKSFVYLAGGEVAGVVVGAKRPVVVTSRSDGARSKLYSIAVAALMTNFEREVRVKIGKVHM